ncbi:bifunctional methylenetetrahydrofolate dehydrogenase/methenyltetrahydrofolate cyclohydrolase FolD [Lysinibacillus fusiformis]|jgi:methylenetetrahydrofolate dehydrogenase (NADP+)/methenyltetrahydrofolate cyclohydrolase|uniref:bifunctional methylenetetrahydrofolate dehydrogenase/methenyltetrahydrofolate cyclohydrolase FolD n=1 Tax=Lysinibacillus TaxID=400634 RepID=UPI0004D782CE|nr:MULTISPECIES: bifunctional methylenetetrahydrofolate dehydrogenase/methenyltetrahydrofolate cyclohydrolase FolD [Lysinibacillus]AJK87272.1 5,10-methylene-tetrahydrofolate cyclohydrolase [Lysinibacillus fusiformis]KAB0443650.1 bifunctional 5,10-methylene-tetrahydrofolate dehydrogenase/5,10-methylene-tetrahydrofolate cyclohydrolase [Lysinibacillus fusiformis]KEK12351.1 5,10-methylene-tetrahydrofolate cyclohydrolase [Lysinibacillus sphaericus]KGA81029.1 5,10-methylene-tetrahydrofolate cyclohydr
MSSAIINGKEIGQEIRNAVAERVIRLKEQGLTPGLAVVLVGDNQASATYVRNKQKSCEAIGMYSELIKLPEETTQEELLTQIQLLNQREDIHGILVQLPLPKHIDEDKVIATIAVEKDVDGFSPVSVGKMMLGQETFLPCTPFGVMKLLEYSGIEIAGKHAVIVGRSHIVGKPMGQLLLQKDATVTYTHSKTPDLPSFTKQADILIAAVGRANFITKEHVKDGAVVIDVGINRDDNNKLCGDVNFAEVDGIASHITPVPGGVGPMTITMLLFNTVQAAENKLAN